MIETKLILRDNFKLAYTIFESNNAKGVILIVHGAKEHRKRYYDFAKYLNNNGYIVIISDNRGHGESVNDDYPLGFIPDYKIIVDDIIELSNYIRKEYKLPIYLMGHSLGSMFVRMVIAKDDKTYKKLILSGTANYVRAGIIGIWIGNILKLVKGSHSYSKLLESFANFLDDSWVCGNKESMKKYRSDKYCTYKYPIASMIEIFKINKDMHKISNYSFKNKDLSIFSVSGKLDPVTGFKKGLKDSMNTLERIGYTDITFNVYDNMYHEVLNELDKRIVYKDILDFIEK